MISYFIGLDLPLPIKQQLNTLCYGLPYTTWSEKDDFHIALSYIGPVNNQVLDDIKESLIQVSFLPFSIYLKGIDSCHSKRGEGTLWSDAYPVEPLINLKKSIDKNLKDLAITPPSHSFKPHVILGKYDSLPAHRLIEYLTMHSLYRSEWIAISRFTLFSTQITPKRIIYQQIQQFVLESKM